MERGNYAVTDVTRLFVADAVLPVQVVRPPADRWLWRLCLAILEDALKCLEARAVRRARVVARARSKREAWDWMMADAEYCLSFTAVCSVLHLDVEAVRKQLRHRFVGEALQAGMSRKLRHPLSRAPLGRIVHRTGARLSLKRKSDRGGRGKRAVAAQ